MTRQPWLVRLHLWGDFMDRRLEEMHQARTGWSASDVAKGESTIFGVRSQGIKYLFAVLVMFGFIAGLLAVPGALFEEAIHSLPARETLTKAGGALLRVEACAVRPRNGNGNGVAVLQTSTGVRRVPYPCTDALRNVQPGSELSIEFVERQPWFRAPRTEVWAVEVGPNTAMSYDATLASRKGQAVLAWAMALVFSLLSLPILWLLGRAVWKEVQPASCPASGPEP